ncbi:MAG: acetolactate synthase [bacterium]|nr:acetolactate synthase [bacterium]
MSLKQISVFLENKPGMMFSVTELLAQNNIDMRALSLAETSEFGIVRLIVDDVYATSTILKDAGFIHNITKVLGVAIPDEPGGLHHVLQALKDADINVEYMYAFLGGKESEHAYMIFRVQDNKAAVAAMAAKGIRCVDQDEIASL